MPDLRGFSMTRNGAVTVSVPRFVISGQIVDSTTGELIADFSGANAITFPQVLGQLTNPQVAEVVEMIVSRLVSRRLGIDLG